jgi:hypothetical protein
MSNIQSIFREGTPVGPTFGNGRFHPGDVSQAPFSASLDISGLATGEKLVAVASAKVDQDWQTVPGVNVQPNVSPQSHVVNARTNESWHHENNGKVIHGRLHWFSVPLTIILRDDDKSGDPVAIELSSRYANQSSIVPDTASSKGNAAGRGLGTALVAVVAAVLLAGVVVGSSYLRHRLRQAKRSRVREFIDDGSAPSPYLRGDSETANHAVDHRIRGYTDLPDDREVEMT